MDKLKQRAKRKRLMQKRREAAEADRQLAKEFNEHYKALGMRHDFTTVNIKRAYNEIKREITCESIVASTIVTLWVMNKLYGYAGQRLFRLASEITIRVGWVGRGERSIAQLDEELQLDAHLRYMDYWKEPDLPDGLSQAEQQRRSMILDTVKYVLPIHLHAVFYTLFSDTITRRSVRMERITGMIIGAVTRAVTTGSLEHYRKSLENHGFKIDMKGRYGGERVTEVEYNKYMKRIKPYAENKEDKIYG